MNRVGIHGKGESVWLGFFLIEVLRQFGTWRAARGRPRLRRILRNGGHACASNIDSTPGTATGIAAPGSTTARRWARPANANARSTRSRRAGRCCPGVGDPARARAGHGRRGRAPGAREAGLVQLLDPPFDQTDLDPGYIKGYVPGVRENGGQYTHAAIWAAMAFAALGDSRAPGKSPP
jgi:cyclic beta-1,2-glucan synthetase